MNEKQEMLRLAATLGIAFTPVYEEIKRLRLNQLKMVDLLPDMLIMVRSLIAEESFSFRRKPIGVVEKGLLISFQNMFNTEETASERTRTNQPYVHLIPTHLESEVFFPKDVHIQQITILVELEYLKRFIGKDQEELDYLLDVEKTFWIEEFMSPEMTALVNELANLSPDSLLSQAYYRLKALELIYLLFRNLLNREKTMHHDLSNAEIDAVYVVRNALEASLEKPVSNEELVKLSGMNELKLRKIFKQVFGKGIYEYYNHLRMQEAARLLKQKQLSVSEVGYRLGFSNLSYFGRLFEKHYGLKPKKWSREQQME